MCKKHHNSGKPKKSKKQCKKCGKLHGKEKKENQQLGQETIKLVGVNFLYPDHPEAFSKNIEKKNISANVNPSITNPVPDSIWVTGAPLIWSQGNAGEGVKIGIIDTGIDSSHPVLLNKVVKRNDYVKDGARTTQFNPHGTHVAGTICADNNNLKGIAPKVSLYDYRVLDKNGSGSYASVTQAIRDAANDGCHLINMSLGGPTNYSPMRDAVKYAVSKGCLIIVAAGNEGPGKISYPANYPEVISVGAVQFDATVGKITLPSTPWFSNTNPEVDVCADGWQVYSCIPNNQYAIYSGTSMATPHVTGFGALLRNRLKRKYKRDPTYIELYTYLKASTFEIQTLSSNLIGAGFVTIYPELPNKDNQSNWFLPSLSINDPL
jgi:major intracellular serine protease